MDMSPSSMSMSMPMSMSMASAATPSTSTAAGGIGSMDSMGSMSGGMDMGSCKSSMTWNWFTTGACFLSPTWYISSKGMFAGSCIGVIGLVIALEFLRRVQREYNRLINRQDDDAATAALVAGRASTTSVDEHNPAKVPHANVATILSHDLPTTRVQADRMTLLRRQLVRALLHMMQFGVAYIIMLIAMSFNGYIIICILIGAFLGSFIFSWDNLLNFSRNEVSDVTGCCG